MIGQAFLAFSLGPVQSFIGAARTVRDLWTGSHLLSWLTFHAMEPVIEACGDQSLVFPATEKNPLRLWKQTGDARRYGEALLTPCLPNRFLATVPADDAAKLAAACEKACRQGWRDVCDRVRQRLDDRRSHPTLAADANSLWNRQVGSFFEVVTAVLPWQECRATVLRELLADPKLPEDDSGLWGARWQLVMRFLLARRSVRHFPRYALPETERDEVAQKCTLLGTLEHVGPGNRGAANAFWKETADKWDHGGTCTGERERLCAVSLVKRFAWPDYFAPTLDNLDVRTKRLADTATVAASRWLRAGTTLEPDEVRGDHRDWSGQWLHWDRRDQDDDEQPVPADMWDRIQAKRKAQGRPPAYLAVLSMDGDSMGDRLAKVTSGDGHRRISAALARFALNEAGAIVEKHHGELIYAGGDDVLALLPTETALECAAELNTAFSENWKQAFPNEPPATVSAGLAVVHYKEDLRFALAQAHEAEKDAKKSGRNALQLIVCRRSGEHSSAFCPWTFLDRVGAWVDAFKNKASDRWAYRLKAELPTLAGLDPKAVAAELRRQVGRSEERTRNLLGGADAVADALNQYVGDKKDTAFAAALGDFVTLCQSASFLARGRDA